MCSLWYTSGSQRKSWSKNNYLSEAEFCVMYTWGQRNSWSERKNRTCVDLFLGAEKLYRGIPANVSEVLSAVNISLINDKRYTL
jgi:hypothetical protein